MNFQKSLILITSFILLILTGCGSNPANNQTANSKSNVNAVNANAEPNSSGATTVTKKPEAETTNNAPTLAPVVQAYYDALKKKDDAGLKKVLSQDVIKSTQADMKDEKAAGTMAAYLAETDTIPEKPVEVRNEKINGEKAVAEVKGGAYLVWSPIAFVKEDGQWKLSNENPDVEAVKSAAKANGGNPAK